MLLYLVRHAVAAEPSPLRPDALRPLTPAGERKFAAAVRGAERLGWRCDRVYHSPLLRAVQTAALLRPLARGPLTSLPDLARPPDVELLARLEGERVAVVGHQPFLGDLLAWLSTGDPAQGSRFPLKKGSFAVLAGPLRPGAMELRALVPPKLLRRLGA